MNQLINGLNKVTYLFKESDTDFIILFANEQYNHAFIYDIYDESIIFIYAKSETLFKKLSSSEQLKFKIYLEEKYDIIINQIDQKVF